MRLSGHAIGRRWHKLSATSSFPAPADSGAALHRPRQSALAEEILENGRGDRIRLYPVEAQVYATVSPGKIFVTNTSTNTAESAASLASRSNQAARYVLSNAMRPAFTTLPTIDVQYRAIYLVGCGRQPLGDRFCRLGSATSATSGIAPVAFATRSRWPSRRPLMARLCDRIIAQRPPRQSRCHRRLSARPGGEFLPAGSFARSRLDVLRS